MAETVGSLVDKICIAELKIYHMAEQRDREDVDDEFRSLCDEKLAVMREQRSDLAEELRTLLSDISDGTVVSKVYRQFKMYNDPKYRRSQEGSSSA